LAFAGELSLGKGNKHQAGDDIYHTSRQVTTKRSSKKKAGEISFSGVPPAF
jgi:hypothetical protein